MNVFANAYVTSSVCNVLLNSPIEPIALHFMFSITLMVPVPDCDGISRNLVFKNDVN